MLLGARVGSGIAKGGLRGLSGIGDVKSRPHHWLAESAGGTVGKGLSRSSSLGCIRRRRVVLGDWGSACHTSRRALGRQRYLLWGRSHGAKERLGVLEPFGVLARA